MAGFAVVMTFLFWGFVLFVAAIIFSTVLFIRAKRTCPEPTSARRWYRIASLLTPFLCILWLVVATVVHARISNDFAHQSVSYSPDPYVILPNGFKLGSLNTYNGYIVAPGYRTDVPVTGPGYVRSIIDLQWDGDTFRGTLFDFKSSTRQNFNFNTKSLQIETSPVGPTTWNRANDEAQAGPESYWILYKRYRHAWPAYAFFAILAVGEAIIVWAFIRLRRQARNSQLEVSVT